MLVVDEGLSNDGVITTISVTTTVTTEKTVVITNGAIAVTITLPSPVTNVGMVKHIVRGTTSTGVITVAPGAGLIEALNGTLGATTTLTLIGTLGAKVLFMSNGSNWLRIVNG